jgi:hypothetical protein
MGKVLNFATAMDIDPEAGMLAAAYAGIALFLLTSFIAFIALAVERIKRRREARKRRRHHG